MPDKVAPAERQFVPGKDKEDGIKFKKELGLFNGVAIIVGVIVGAGIFVSPKGVIEYSGSVGLSIVVWIFSGLLSLVGALCYAELGTMIPKSGGDYAYISDAFGPLPAFLYLWVALFILVPTGNAITALTFAQYILQPLWSDCKPPYAAIRLLAAVIMCLLTAINCSNVKWATKVQGIFTGTKIFALVIIILAGICRLWNKGMPEHFRNPMQDTITKPGSIALAIYSGVFSYSGWNYLNFVTEELKDPYRNLPRAICISLPLITIIYVFANIAYFAVLTPSEILASNAVAVTFADNVLGTMAWIMPVFVACSTFGALNGAIFASSRLFFVGARNGHLPNAIALINIKNLTPIPSLIFLCIISLVLLLVEDVFNLINYVSFVEALFTTLSVSGLLWMRRTRPDLVRPIKVSLLFPIIFLIVCALLVACSCFEAIEAVGVGLIVIFSGIPVYWIFIRWNDKPKWLMNSSNKLNIACAKLFMCVPEERDD